MNSRLKTIIDLLAEELERAEKKHPSWPRDPIHAAAIVAEESGELVQAALQTVYENRCPSSMTNEAIQTGAMAIRFLLNISDE